jgi:hypothetical protein
MLGGEGMEILPSRWEVGSHLLTVTLPLQLVALPFEGVARKVGGRRSRTLHGVRGANPRIMPPVDPPPPGMRRQRRQ